MSRRKKDIEKISEYINKEKKKYPENKWVRYYEMNLSVEKGEKYEIFYEDVEDKEMQDALRILNQLAKAKDIINEILKYVEKYPFSQYIPQIISEIDLKNIPVLYDSLKEKGLKIKILGDYMVYYVIKNFKPGSPEFKERIKDLYLNYDFKNYKNLVMGLLMQYFDWNEIKWFLKKEAYNIASPDLTIYYAQNLQERDKNYKDALNLLKKVLKVQSSEDYYNKINWVYNKETRENFKKEEHCYLFYLISKSYYNLGDLRNAMKYIKLSMENETEDLKTNYKLAGDIFYDLNKKDKAEEYYLIHYAETRDSTVIDRLKNLYKGDDFEKYLVSGRKNVIRKKMLKKKSPDFKLHSMDGKIVSLNDYKGKVIVLNFWATWCGPCKKEIPYLNILFEKYRTNKDVIFIGITDEEKKDVEEFLKKQEYKPIILLGNVKSEFGVYGVPTTFIIDKNGFIQFRHIGFGDGMGDIFLKELSEEIEILLE